MSPKRICLFIANFTLVGVYQTLTIFRFYSYLCSLPPHQPISTLRSSTNQRRLISTPDYHDMCSSHSSVILDEC